jgi:hypothetical protein
MSRRSFATALVLTFLVLTAASAPADNVYVASNGLDSTICGLPVLGSSCGSKAFPCRSIQCGINWAKPGDTVVVGPGRYGDLDLDGALGDVGEEFGSPGCGCMVSVNKSITLTSSDGAAATVIDARAVDVHTNVLIIATDATFGKPGKGFTVTRTDASDDMVNGIVIDGANVDVRGNQVVGDGSTATGFLGTGVFALTTAADVLIEANQVMSWATGIRVDGAGKLVRKNQVSMNADGIVAGGTSAVVGNVTTANNNEGIRLGGAATATGNATHDILNGIATASLGAVEGNNIFGSSFGGLEVDSVTNAPATNNFWGLPSGPGLDPADRVLSEGGGTAVTTPFATKPFKVKAPVKP